MGPEEWELTVLIVRSCDIVQYKLSLVAEYEQLELASTLNIQTDIHTHKYNKDEIGEDSIMRFSLILHIGIVCF